MRTKNSIKNIYMSILTQIVITIMGFISRKVFLDNLDAGYLGINGLLTNIFSMMSLVEGGVGVSIIYNLYKPLAENNQEKVIALIQLYKRIYNILAIVIFIISLAVYPVLGYFVKDSDGISFIGTIYFIFIIKNIISYLNAHKWSLINADQKAYVLAKYNLIFKIITTILSIVVLVVTKNYIAFLLIEVFVFIFQNIYNGKVVNERYPYIKTKQKYKVDDSIKKNLITNVKALFLHNIGGWVVLSTDNLFISGFISLATVGIYSNYSMIIGQLKALITPIINGIEASVGNLIATEDSEKNYSIFKIVYLVNFWIYSFIVIFLFNLLEPFINWWLGENLLLDKVTFFFILINLYLMGLRAVVLMFKSKAGIFSQDKYMPLLEALINLVASFILVKKIGLAGIFIGTTISTIAVPVWTQSYLIYKNIFKRSIGDYFKKYLLYIALTLGVGSIITYLCSFIVIGTFMALVIRGVICLIGINLIYVMLFYKTKEFQYLWNVLKDNLFKKIKLRRRVI